MFRINSDFSAILSSAFSLWGKGSVKTQGGILSKGTACAREIKNKIKTPSFGRGFSIVLKQRFRI